MDYSKSDHILDNSTSAPVAKSIYTREYKLFLRLLRESRRRAGLTQAELAIRLNQTQSFVSKCERGERRIDVVELRHFCAAIGISFAELTKKVHKAMQGGK